jgi:hypothetical protein
MTTTTQRTGHRVRRGVVALACLTMLALTAASAQTFVWFQPFRLVSYSLLDAGPTPAGRFSVAVIEDRDAPATCIAVVVDSATGAFVATSVSTESCVARRTR